MTRIERAGESSSKVSRSWIGKIAKFFSWCVRLPFKITLRALAVALLLFVFIQIVRTGIWTIPYASDLLYSAPMPSREVDKKSYSPELLRLQIEESIIASRYNSNPTFILHEGQITSLVEQAMLSDHQPFLTGQLVVMEEKLEFFGNLRSNPHVYITAELIPEVVDDKLSASISEAKVGNVRIPKTLVSSGVSEYLTSSLFRSLLPNITLNDILLEDRQVSLIGISQ